VRRPSGSPQALKARALAIENVRHPNFRGGLPGLPCVRGRQGALRRGVAGCPRRKRAIAKRGSESKVELTACPGIVRLLEYWARDAAEESATGGRRIQVALRVPEPAGARIWPAH